MSIATAVCDSYTKEVMEGVHLVADTYKIALIKPASAGTLGAATANYSDLATDEASGTGYSAGGLSLTGTATALEACRSLARLQRWRVALLRSTSLMRNGRAPASALPAP
jgi:hypothetical protein